MTEPTLASLTAASKCGRYISRSVRSSITTFTVCLLPWLPPTSVPGGAPSWLLTA